MISIREDGEAAADGGRLDDYDYTLPQERIALRPASPRDSARLLVAAPDGTIGDHVVRDLCRLLRPGDRLVVNDSRVIPARLSGRRVRGEDSAGVEVTLISPLEDGSWQALARPAKRLRAEDVLEFGADGALQAVVLSREGPNVALRFEGDPLSVGTMPLPPYIAARRAPDARDAHDYQNVYARPPGSVAAPTAGLHFTDDLLAALDRHGVGLTRVTLHVGPGTFLPVSAGAIEEHVMHAERGVVSAEAVEEVRATRQAGGRIVAVGTTSLRLLESAAATGRLAAFDGETDLFIRPGSAIRVADALMTNFHLPRSTLLMLVAGFVGYERMRAVYDHALAGSYRFYSYGDASLLWRPQP